MRVKPPLGQGCRAGELVPSLTLLFSRSVVSDSLSCMRPHALQHTRLLCPPLSPGVCSNSCPLSRWFSLTISSSTTLFSFRLQSCPTSGSFPVSRLFASGGQNIGASASVLLMRIQGWFPLGLMGWISLQSRALSGIFPRTTVWKHCALSSVLSWMLVANCWGVLPSNWQLVFISLGAKIPSGLQLFYFSSSKCVSWFFYLPPLSLVITCVTGANKNIFFFLNSLNISSIS